MPVGSYSGRAVCTANPGETIRSVALRMRKEGVGLLVVTEQGQPVGVLTDRDVALRVLADGRDPGTTRVAAVMTPKPVTLAVDASLPQATEAMSREGVRRIPLVDRSGKALGLIAADDIIRLLAKEVGGLAGIANAQLPVGVQVGAAVSPEEQVLRPVDHYHRDVATIRADADVAVLAEQMRNTDVGCIVVVGDAEEPLGVVTDRDLALRVVAAGLDPRATPVSTIMSAPVVTAEESQPIEEIVETMTARGIRRIPVLSHGRLVGIVTFDDLVVAFGRELQQLGRATALDVQVEAMEILPRHSPEGIRR